MGRTDERTTDGQVSGETDGRFTVGPTYGRTTGPAYGRPDGRMSGWAGRMGWMRLTNGLRDERAYDRVDGRTDGRPYGWTGGGRTNVRLGERMDEPTAGSANMQTRTKRRTHEQWGNEKIATLKLFPRSHTALTYVCYVCVCACTCVHTCACVCVRVYVFVRVFVCMCRRAGLQPYIIHRD